MKPINETVGFDGILSTLLLFDAICHRGLPKDLLTPSRFRRATAVRKATELMARHSANRQVHGAMRSQSGPVASEIQKAPIWSLVLVDGPYKEKREEPFTLLGNCGEDVTVVLPPPSGPTRSCSTVVCPYIVKDSPSPNPSTQLPNSQNFHITVFVATDNKDDFPLVILNVLICDDQFLPSAWNRANYRASIMTFKLHLGLKSTTALSKKRIQTGSWRQYWRSPHLQLPGRWRDENWRQPRRLF